MKIVILRLPNSLWGLDLLTFPSILTYISGFRSILDYPSRFRLSITCNLLRLCTLPRWLNKHLGLQGIQWKHEISRSFCGQDIIVKPTQLNTQNR